MRRWQWVVLAVLAMGAGAWIMGWRLRALQRQGVVMPWAQPHQ